MIKLILVSILFHFNLCLGATLPKPISKHIPKNIIHEVQENINKNNSETLEFVSGESKTGDGKAIINKIKFIPSKNIWLMNQRIIGSQRSTQLAIVVKNKMSYFLELDHQGKLKPYSASCLTCHANGPRKIRPLKMIRGKNKLDEWNKKIISYGKLDNFKSAYPKSNYTRFHSGVPIELDDKLNQQPLVFSKCIGCHSSESKFRNVLKRQNIHTIMALINNGKSHKSSFDKTAREKFMPASDDRLNDDDRRCLKIWFYQPSKYKTVDDCLKESSLRASNKADKKQKLSALR